MSRHVTQSCASQSACPAIRGRWRRTSCCFVAASLVVVVSFAGEDDEDDAPAAVAVNARQIRITDQSFDQMVFGGPQQQQQVVQQANGRPLVVSVSQPNGTDFRKRMEASVTYEIRAVVRNLSLTEAQMKKLQLAARGDIAQHVSRAEDLRPKLTSKPLDQQQYVELMRELQPLRTAQQFGILGDNSLFRKTLRTILTDEQRVQLRIVERERQAAIIESALQNLERDINGLKLMGETRRKFAEVILEHGRVPQIVGGYGQYVVLLEGNLLRDRIKPLLTEAEWEKLQSQVGIAKRIEPTLEASGIWSARRSTTDDDETKD